jgi:chromosome partitioning protein
MNTVAVLNLKGGAGKTTIGINLAAVLGERKHRVVFLDLDPQQSATRWESQGTEKNVITEISKSGDK